MTLWTYVFFSLCSSLLGREGKCHFLPPLHVNLDDPQLKFSQTAFLHMVGAGKVPSGPSLLPIPVNFYLLEKTYQSNSYHTKPKQISTIREVYVLYRRVDM